MKTRIILFLSFIVVLTFFGCQQNCTNVVLPNGYVACHSNFCEKFYRTSSLRIIAYTDSLIYSREKYLEEKSRINGVITYLGFPKKGDSTRISINNIGMNAQGGNGGFIISKGGNATNNVDLANNSVIIKITTSGAIKEYIMQLKSLENELIPAISLEYLKVGQKISIPTVRRLVLSSSNRISAYEILNSVDVLYLHEIRQ